MMEVWTATETEFEYGGMRSLIITIRDQRDQTICQTSAGLNDPEAIAAMRKRAALIVQAPVMLEALEAVQWCGRDSFRCVECEGQPSTGHTKACRVGCAIIAAAQAGEPS